MGELSAPRVGSWEMDSEKSLGTHRTLAFVPRNAGMLIILFERPTGLSQ
jgi:hypothetical protein